MKPESKRFASFDLERSQEFSCPFCGKRALFGKLKGQRNHAVLHDEPACETFQNKHPLDYLRTVETFASRGVN